MWIPVSERLPKQGYQFVLVAQNGASVIMAQFNEGFFYALGEDAWDFKLRHVTHWMPMPEPPE